MDAVVTVFVRHSADCKHRNKGEFYQACKCRKHLRWTFQGKQYRKTAGTRSWERALEAKRFMEAKVTGTPLKEKAPQSLANAVVVFLKDKQNQGITAKVIGKYTRELARLREFCESKSVFLVRDLTRELLTHYSATWADVYPASLTRSKVRERLRSFLRYCWESEWLTRIPEISRIKVQQTPTLPLSQEEYARLLDTFWATFADDAEKRKRVHALVQLMRWSGLAIGDALTLDRNRIIRDATKDIYRIVTSRQKTGVDVSVPIPHEVAEEILNVLNGNNRYVFWSGNGSQESATKNMAKFMAKLFEDAGLENGGYMKSHRLRDTFACELLQSGVPLEEVSKLLGHKSIKTTEAAYGQWVKSRQDRLDSLVIGTWNK